MRRSSPSSACIHAGHTARSLACSFPRTNFPPGGPISPAARVEPASPRSTVGARRERVGQMIERLVESPLADATLAGRVRHADRLLADPKPKSNGMATTNRTVIVTGASQGIGAALANP